MLLIFANLLSWLIIIYFAAGFLFALYFVFRGIGRVDAVAAQSTAGFKLIILPGVMALWPLMWRRWRQGRGKPPEENNPHRREACRLHCPPAGKETS